MKMRKIARK